MQNQIAVMCLIVKLQRLNYLEQLGFEIILYLPVRRVLDIRLLTPQTILSEWHPMPKETIYKNHKQKNLDILKFFKYLNYFKMMTWLFTSNWGLMWWKTTFEYFTIYTCTWHVWNVQISMDSSDGQSYYNYQKALLMREDLMF